MFVEPVFNQNSNRPYRWSLQIMRSGDIMDRYWMPEEHYTHWTDKTSEGGAVRDVFNSITPFTHGNFMPMRRKNIGFLTTYHKEFYEDGKYTEVHNDPVNYITIQPTDYSEAFIQAEQRIGNYRKGARQTITHLGGTISEDQLDDLSTVVNADFHPVASLSFPFFPKLPTDYTKAPRINLLTTDLGYVNFLKSMHPADTTPIAVLSEQGNAFRRFIYGATDQANSSATLTDSGMVKIVDIETVLDAAITADVGAVGINGVFLATQSGEDITVNIPGYHVIRSDTTGLHFEMYSDDTLTGLVSSIDIDRNTGIITLDADGTTIVLTNDGTVAINAGSNNLTITAATVAITGALTVSSNVDIEGTLDVLGATTHGV